MNGVQSSPPQAAAAQSRVTERMLAPDLARGMMLLLIVVAHAPLYLVGVSHGVTGYPAGGTLLDQVVRTGTLLLVDARAYPMFAALFGYGLVMVIQRRMSRGASRPQARRYLRRRGFALVLLGLLHALIVTPVEILGAYGVAVLLLGWLLFRPARTIAVAATVLAPVFVVTVSAMFVLTDGAAKGANTDEMALGALGYGVVDLVVRLIVWLVAIVTNVAVYPVLIALLLGALAARFRILEEPQQYRRLLRRLAVGGIAVSVLGAVPLAWLEATQAAAEQSVLGSVSVWATVHALTGLAGGLGYTAVFGLLGAWLQQRHAGTGPVVWLLSVTGSRALTCYLVQSALMVALLSQTFVGLGGQVNSAGAAGAAVCAWLGGVAFAALLAWRGRPGPVDAGLRWFVYRGEDNDGPAERPTVMRAAPPPGLGLPQGADSLEELAPVGGAEQTHVHQQRM